MSEQIEQMGTSGGGSSVEIEINPDELAAIINQIVGIMLELETNAFPAVEKLAETDFYKGGQAGGTKEAFASANIKFLELFDHYERASTLVTKILEEMIRTDEEIAVKVIEALEV